MAIKPPGDVLQQLGELLGESGLKGEVNRSARALAQSALSRLDMVSRAEFDAQAEALARTQARVAELEAELAALTADEAGGR